MPELLVDANVLLRFLTDEPRDLADRANAVLEAAERSHVDLIVSPLIFAEVVYVLESVYTWQRAAIAHRLLDLVSAGVLLILERETINQSLRWYRDVAGVDFADAYVAASAATRGHGRVLSFDRHLRRLPGITVLSEAGEIRGST
jgi:predicted nucleic-acid-binding protein